MNARVGKCAVLILEIGSINNRAVLKITQGYPKVLVSMHEWLKTNKHTRVDS